MIGIGVRLVGMMRGMTGFEESRLDGYFEMNICV